MNRMHKPRDLPSLDLLKAFEAAARRLSFTKAGAELFLSQSAVSRQIQQLEEQLGVQLFLRRTRALLLTDAGQRYFRAVAQVVEQLRDATARLGATSQARTVTVTTTVTFAALWLVPRLADLQERHPEVAVHVAADNAIRDLERERLDVSIRYATRRVAGPEAVKLFGESVVPVCSPKLLAKRVLNKPEDLEHFVLLHFEDPEQRTPWVSWDVWFEAMKMKRVVPKGTLHFSHYDQVVGAAIKGQGVALGRLPLIGGPLQDGTLVMPLHDERYSTRFQDRGYWLITAQSARGRPEVQKFVQWLGEQASGASTSVPADSRATRRSASRR